MTWELLDEFQPTWEWQVTDRPLVSPTTIKIEQDWSYEGVFPGKAFCWLVQQFPDGSYFNFRKLFPYRDPRLINLIIPEPLQGSGWNVYNLALKVNTRARWQDDADWRFRIYQWTGTSSPPLTPFPSSPLNSPAVPDLIYDGGIANS